MQRRIFWAGTLAGGVYWLIRYLRPQHSILVLNEKVVLVTGASAGIGRALALAFARRGARLVLVARNVERLEAVRREIEPYTADILIVPADLTDEAQLQQVIEQTLAHFGRIDVLVNNAGILLGGPLQEQNPVQIEQLLRLNLWVIIRLSQLVLPHMLSRRDGYILIVGSGLGRNAAPFVTTYVASKFGLSAFTDALRRELDRTGVHLTLVQPSWTDTETILPEVAATLRHYGFRIEHPDYVAERAIQGLVRGENEVIMGGLLPILAVYTERYAPFLLRIYWRLRLTPEWRDAMSKLGR